MARTTCLHMTLVPLLVGLASGLAAAGESSALSAAVTMEKVLVDVIARTEKSVVAIARVPKEQPGESLNFEFRPDPFNRRGTRLATPQPTDPEFIPEEFGTGVVVDRRGLILTVYHVLGEDPTQSQYYVTTSERKVYQARIKAADPRSDLAVLEIKANDLVPIVFGDAGGLRKGQIVISLGNPYAIARDGQVSAAWGIVSNLARKAPAVPDGLDSSGKTTLHQLGTLIQTDAKLNLGTSGGPLLNLKGQMVGLVTSLAALAGYEQAAGYAIPLSQTFRRVVETLKQGREVEYGFLGVRPVNLSYEELLQGRQGIRVHEVVPGTPAHRQGLKRNDIITAVNGTPLVDADSLVLEVGRLPVEAVVRLSILRKDRPQQLNVTLAKYRVLGKKVVTARPKPWRGMRVDYPTALIDLNRRWRDGQASFGNGVIIAEVEEGKPAWQAGLRPGMLVSHVDRTAVRTPRQFRSAVAKSTGPVRLRVGDAKNTVRVVGVGS